jgi:hypothetical protein
LIVIVAFVSDVTIVHTGAWNCDSAVLVTVSLVTLSTSAGVSKVHGLAVIICAWSATGNNSTKSRRMRVLGTPAP